MSKLSVKDLSLKDKRVIMRVDFNTPIDSSGKITDNTRIRLAIPTIEYILKHGASLILMSHLGRPKGKKDEKFSLKPVAIHLSSLLGKEVKMADDCIGKDVEELASSLTPGNVLLLENLRFHPEEEKPELNPEFAKSLASLADIYINDAFGTAHRKHSSTYSIAEYFPKVAATGFLMEKELKFLLDAISNPEKPFYAIIGGAKIGSKIKIFTTLIEKVDAFFIGGGMAYTFYKAMGKQIGDSICDNEMVKVASDFLEEAKQKQVPVYLPIDNVVANDFKSDANYRTILSENGIEDGWQGMDIGEGTIKLWKGKLENGKTIFWNGPMGVFEMDVFAKGTFAIAKTLASLSATTIVGGGDSVSAINTLNLEESFSHVSTGGGASLELIENGSLPGYDALSDK
ncbi:MAG: Bifunctional PGK/TIM [Chlamydiia bacterium]|nr:Bifunctional PGK/TIM [Chlamydiia bacterium]